MLHLDEDALLHLLEKVPRVVVLGNLIRVEEVAAGEGVQVITGIGGGGDALEDGGGDADALSA